MKSNCTDVAPRLTEYLEETLTSSDRDVVTAHLNGCDACRAELSAITGAFNALRALPAIECSNAVVSRTVNEINSAEERRMIQLRRVAKAVGIAIAAVYLILAGTWTFYNRLTPAPWDLRVIGQDTLATGETSALRIQLLNRDNNQPIPEVPVHVELVGTDKAPIRLASFTTGADGSGDISFTAPDWVDGIYSLRVVAEGAGVSDTLTQRIRLTRPFRVMLSTDKLAYQPGQTLHMRVLALRGSAAKPASGKSVRFTIRDQLGNRIFDQEHVASEFGLAAADCPLSDEITTGRYEITAIVDTTETTASVDIARYTLPPFRVTLSVDKPFYAPGETVHGTVESAYYFGKPVSDAKAVVRVSQQHSNDSQLAPHGIGDPITAPLTLTLDAEGRGTFEFTLPNILIGTAADGANARISIAADVTDSANSSHQATLGRIVTVSPIRVTAIADAGAIVPGAENRIWVITTYADGRPAETQLTIRGYAAPVATSPNGVAVVDMTLDSRARLQIQARDGDGLRGHTERDLTSLDGADAFAFTTDKAVYSGGESVELHLFGAGAHSAAEPLYLDVIHEQRSILSRTIRTGADTSGITIDLPPEAFGTFELVLYRIDAETLSGLRARRVIQVNRADDVQIAATLDQLEYRPGDTARLSIALTDADGQPVRGAVSLAVIDQALSGLTSLHRGMQDVFQKLDDEFLKPLIAIYARDPWRPNVAPQQLQLANALFASSARPAQQFGATGRRNGADADQPFTLAADTFADRAFDVARQSRNGMRFTQTIAIGFVIPSGLAAILIAGAMLSRLRATIITIGALLVLVFLIGLMTPSLSRARELAVGAIAGGEGAWDSSVVSAGATESKSAPATRIREWFPETLLWQPQLVTDDNGRASLEFPVADAITTWDLSASAVTADGAIGSLADTIRVFQPFFVDVRLPLELTRGDEIGIPVVVYNYLDAPQSVTLKVDSADWFERLDDAPLTLDLQPGDVRSITVPIRAVGIGDNQFTVHARSTDSADAIRRTTRVTPQGYRIDQSHSGAIESDTRIDFIIPDNAVSDSGAASLRIFPTVFSQVVDNMDALLQLPHGCFEQTSSSTYPNVLVLDYMSRTGQITPEVEARARLYIHTGYQRLIGFEVSGGGFEWFGNPPANLLLSAYGLAEFQDMARVHPVDPDLIARTRRWIMNQRQSNGCWISDYRKLGRSDRLDEDHSTLCTTAYVLWSLGEVAPADASKLRSSYDYLLRHEPASLDDPYALALVANALLDSRQYAPQAIAYVERLAGLTSTTSNTTGVWGQPDDAAGLFYSFGSSTVIETTALATMALHKARVHPELTRNALQWLVAQKSPGGAWPTTQATILTLKALLTASESVGVNETRSVKWTLVRTERGNNEQEIIAIGDTLLRPDRPDLVHDIELPRTLTPGNYTLQLNCDSKASPSFLLAARHNELEAPLPDIASPFDITVTFDRSDITTNETVRATATLANRSRIDAPMVMLNLPIPPGFDVERSDLDLLVQRGQIARYETNPRQLTIYLREVRAGASFTLVYTLRATMPVRVTIPAAQAWEYYNPTRRALSAPGTIRVIRPA